MTDTTSSELLPGLAGALVKKRLVDMGDGTFAEMTVATLAASANNIGTVNLGALGGAATAANQALTNASLTLVASPFVVATTAPLSGTIADTVPHLIGPFTPQVARDVCLTINATSAATGTVQLLRSIDGGATTPATTVGGTPWARYAFANALGAIVNEPVWTETSGLATLYLAITLGGGSVTYSLHQ